MACPTFMLDTCLHGHKCIGTALVHQKDTGEGDAVGSGSRTHSQKLFVPTLATLSPLFSAYYCEYFICVN